MRPRRWPWLLLGSFGLGCFGAGAVGAQEGTRTVLGMNAVSASDGIGMTFGDPEAQPYPVAAGQMAHTEATMSTGPAGYALASTAWPGPLIANAGSLAVLLGAPPQAGEVNYGGRAEAFSPAGPHDSELPGMRAHADEAVAEATAGAQDVGTAPGMGSGDVSTISRSSYEAEILRATSSCTASDLTFGDGGAVKIGSVRTEAAAESDGSAATAGGRTVVSGMTVGGQPAEVDENGVRFVDPVTGPVGEQMLSQMGITMFVAQPRKSEEGARASYHAGPLVVLWEPPRSGQLFVYQICGSDASVALRAGTVPGAPSIDPVPSRGPAVPPARTGGVPSTGGSPAAAPPPSGGAAPTPEVALDETPARFVRDLAIWPYVVGALACLAAGYGLRRGHDETLSARAAATACPLEGARR